MDYWNGMIPTEHLAHLHLPHLSAMELPTAACPLIESPGIRIKMDLGA